MVLYQKLGIIYILQYAYCSEIVNLHFTPIINIPYSLG